METTNRQFGLMVAYLLPGFIGLGGIAILMPTVAQWLQPVSGQSGWDIAPPVYAVLAAMAVGMTLSCFRWLILDHVHQWTGITAPAWEINPLEERLEALNWLVEHYYRYYQFYANTLIAVVWTYSLSRWSGRSPLLSPVTDLSVIVLCAGLFFGSRDSLSKYYARTRQLIERGSGEIFRGDLMTNGAHHDHPAGSGTTKPKPEPKEAKKPEPAKSKASTQPR